MQWQAWHSVACSGRTFLNHNVCFRESVDNQTFLVFPSLISRIEECDFILAVGTPAYRQKYENKVSPQGSVVAAEVDLMSRRLIATEAQKASVLPLLLEGEEQTSFPPLLQGRVYANFKQEEHYLATLFDLVLALYHIPFDDPMVRDLRERLRKEASPLASRR